MTKAPNYKQAIAILYLNYLIHGMGVLMLSQNMGALMTQWQTGSDGVFFVASALGIGRLLILPVSGVLSDKLGRKPVIITGMLVYIGFFLGILVSPTIQIAFAVALLAGAANSILDSGTYPALMEAYPAAAGSAGILVKAFISIGQFLLPFLVNLIAKQQAYYGLTFLLSAGILFVSLLFLIKAPFPTSQITQKQQSSDEKIIPFVKKAHLLLDGLPLILIGFTSTATFLLVSNGIGQYAQSVLHLSEATGRQLVSYYSVTSLLGAVLTSIFVKKWVKGTVLLIIYPFISCLSLCSLYFFPSQQMVTIVTALVGFFAAGGVLQLAITTMSELFPQGKGRATAMVGIASSFASFAAPAILAIISKSDVSLMILIDAGIALLGCLCAIIVYLRYHKLLGHVK
ncbi:MFS transporter [Isobaculum melis]|uniref:Predicted arabinose efflux permease, MFS family n=1 Tax=Isobaculum melis TaxID=142588 RepID=A0A1H9SPF0_9LACT|nr:MFS transporter [Isobaculum melis]SER86738.1 Predicted arabinose efflux permease, MFS family [Isobaculum melis]